MALIFLACGREGSGHPEFEGGACVGGVPSERIAVHN